MATTALALVTHPAITSGAEADSPVFEFADPQGHHLSVMDLGVTRGDGVFETISIGLGRPQALEAHLRRFAKSAEAVGLPAPDLLAWRAAVLAVVATLDSTTEAWVKTVYTHGVEGEKKPNGWVYGAHSADFSVQRRDGIRVVTLDRGYRHDVAETAPWLLQGAKTLSYAVNRAVLREAERRDADDVIFVSSDGYVLEGPTSSVLLRRGKKLLTPGTGLAILEGTTQGSIFAFAREHGYETGFELATVEQLQTADALWLVSSVRHAAPITSLDGVGHLVDAELTEAINSHLLTRVD